MDHQFKERKNGAIGHLAAIQHLIPFLGTKRHACMAILQKRNENAVECVEILLTL
jgi:hypothetical protein